MCEMALMIPSEVPDSGTSRAEREVFEVMRDGLDDRFTVFHSFKSVSRNREDKLLDSEIDFLLLTQERGLLVVEVKGGPVAFDGQRGRWYQGDKAIRDPFAQASANAHKLRHFIDERVGRSLPLPIGYAVCFPNSYGEPAILPPTASRDTLMTGKDLDNFSAAVARAYSASRAYDRMLSDKDMEALRVAIMPYCEFGMSLPEQIAQAERKLFTLTEEQCRMLDFIRNRRVALIQGCAGSGKTVMAVKKAQELAQHGDRVLLLAYNQLIGERLKEAVQECDGVTASTYHDYCLAALQAAGRVPGGPLDHNYYTQVVPRAFLALVSQSPLVYDALVVDEGQDFRREYWESLGYLVREDGYRYIFYDPDQNVFGTDMQFPIDEPPFVLVDNCRNTRKICEFVRSCTGREMRPMTGVPVGMSVQQFVNQSPVGRRRHLGQILEWLVTDQHVSADRIVVLGGHGIEKTCVPPDGRIGRFMVSQTGDAGPNVVRYYTYMKFKGCEADAVVLLDVDPADERWSDLAVYTTASRAKFLLFVLRVG